MKLQSSIHRIVERQALSNDADDIINSNKRHDDVTESFSERLTLFEYRKFRITLMPDEHGDA